MLPPVTRCCDGGGGRLATGALAALLVALVPGAAQAEDTPPLDPEAAALPGDPAVSFMADNIYGDGRIYVLEAGRATPGRPTLFLVHGLGNDGVRDFYRILPRLAEKRRVVLFDLPGFGRSTASNRPYAPTAYARVLAQVIEQHASGPIDLLGHSMGGAIAIEYAGLFPARVRRLIVVDAAGILHREALVGEQVRHTSEAVEGVLPQLTGWLRDTADSVVEQSRKLDPAPELILANRLSRKLFLRGDPTRIAALSLVLHDFGPTLAAITAPTLVVWGENDPVAPPRTGVLLADRLAHAELVTLPKVGHFPMAEAPDELMSLIERHLDAPTGAERPPSPAGKSQGDARCQGESGRRFRGVYDRIVLDRCPHARLEEVRARQLVLHHSSASLSRSRVDGGIVAQGSEVIMTGGRVAGDIALDLDDSRLDLAGVTIEARRQPFRLKGQSRLVFSVCSTATGGGVVLTHGVEVSKPPPPPPKGLVHP
jgi:pimeloyl-ACP methyl ester carboxylesterase